MIDTQMKLTILAGLLICILSFSCASVSNLPDVYDDSGAAVKLDRLPVRIISLAPSNTELVYALGLEDRLIGVTEYCNYPPAAKNKAKVGGFSTVDIEKTVALQPDLILATEIHSKGVTPTLQKLGFKVATLNPKTISDVIQDIRLLGRISGKENLSTDLARNMQTRVDAITSRTKILPAERFTRALLILWHDPLMVAGGKTIIDDMIHIAGGDNIAVDITGYGAIGLETIVTRNPDVIIIPTSMGKADSPLLSYVNTDTRLKNINAVKNKTVYTIDGDIVYRYSPRCISALEQMASFLHPEIFGKIKQ